MHAVKQDSSLIVPLFKGKDKILHTLLEKQILVRLPERIYIDKELTPQQEVLQLEQICL